MAARIAQAPAFIVAAPSRAESASLVAAYTRITADAVTSQAKLNLLEAGYRTHGEDFLPLVAETFRRTGSAQNLLLIMRTTPARQSAAPGPSHPKPGIKATSSVRGRVGFDRQASGSTVCGCPRRLLLPGLTYCADHRPGFGTNPDARYDRQPSATESVVAPSEPSTRAAALGGDITSEADLLAAAYRVFRQDLTSRSRSAVLAVLRQPRIPGLARAER